MPDQTCERCGNQAGKYIEALGTFTCDSCVEAIKRKLKVKREKRKIIIAVSKDASSIWIGFYAGWQKNGMIKLEHAIQSFSNTTNTEFLTKRIDEILLKATNFNIYER